jgi:hypothetical protein
LSSDWPTLKEISEDVGLSEKILRRLAEAGKIHALHTDIDTDDTRKGRWFVNPYYLKELFLETFNIPAKIAQKKLSRYKDRLSKYDVDLDVTGFRAS